MIYIGIPVRNERHTIGPLLWRIRELLHGNGRDFRVLVVDDGSTDGTYEMLEPYRRFLPLTVIRHEARRGYAAGLERLVREVVARSDYHRRDALVTLQGDFTDAPEDIPEMVKRFEGGADLVLAVPASPVVAPRRVKIATVGAQLAARLLPRPVEAKHLLGSFRLYRLFALARALEALGRDGRTLLTHVGWAADAELLLRVSPYVRRLATVETHGDYSRRYRESRVRVLGTLGAFRHAVGDRRLRGIGREAARAASRS